MNNRKGIFVYWDKPVQEVIAISSCLGMVAGLMWSRALLSVCMVLLVINALHPAVRKEAWQLWRQSRFAHWSALFFFVYWLSGLWSSDLNSWLAIATNKIPFLFLPFAFFAIPLHKPKVQKMVIMALIIMHIAVILYSLFTLWHHPEYYVGGYNFSRPLPTTKYNDHIRFSISLVLTLVMMFYLLFDKQVPLIKRGTKVFLILSSILFIIYLHVLAAKSGLLCLYIVLLVYGFFMLWKRSSRLALCFGLAILAMPVAAYYLVPTFKKKVHYVKYEIDKTRAEGHFDYSLSDAGRMITYDIGLRAIWANPVIGVGAGDFMEEMRKGYDRYYPEVPQHEQYGPINQFLFTALCVGIPLSLSCVLMVFAPLFQRSSYRLYVVVNALVLLFCIMVEAMLELQFGVFTYLFFILFWLSAGRDIVPEKKVDL